MNETTHHYSKLYFDQNGTLRKGQFYRGNIEIIVFNWYFASIMLQYSFNIYVQHSLISRDFHVYIKQYHTS